MFPEGRLFDFVIVGAVALMVVGPKDLPMLMRKVGQFMARMRAMAAEFRASFDEMARQSELDELRREVDALKNARPMDLAATHLGVGDVIGDIKGEMTSTKEALSAASSFEPPPLAEPTADVAPPAPEPEAPAKPKPKSRRKAAAS